MRRRDFIRYAGSAGVLAAIPIPGAEAAFASTGIPGRGPGAEPQGIAPLPPSVYGERIGRAQQLMSQVGIDALFCEPATNFEYLAGASFGRSERLIALVVPLEGDPFIVAPAFEVERVQRAVVSIPEIRGWEEHEDPHRRVVDGLKPASPGRLGIEPSARFGIVEQLKDVLPQWEFVDGDPVFRRLRIVKSEEEIRLIRRAVSITETSIATTFAALEPGLTDREVARFLSAQMAERGARGGGLVQFGPTSAIPHGGTEDRILQRGMPVLIDAGCRVHGYTSDITRMHFFGDEPSPEYREVFNTVLAAQSSALAAGRPGVACQELDRIARNVIRAAGYGDYFTHRLGHGMGMDGHEPPYLVEGNDLALEPGMVFTIEPGIYLPRRWGVRIEDDVVVRNDGLEPLSSRVSRI